MHSIHNKKLGVAIAGVDTGKDVSNDQEDYVPNISYFTLFKFSSKRDKSLIIVAICASIITGVTLPFAIALVANAFQNMIDYAKDYAEGTHDDETFLTKMRYFGVYYSFIGLIFFVGGYLSSALMNLAAINQIYKIRKEYLRALLNQDFSYYDLSHRRDFASKMADDVVKLEAGIGHKLTSFINNLTTAVACIFMATIKGWKLALLCLTMAPITLLLVGCAGMIANRLSKTDAVLTSRASSIAEEVLSSIRTVYAFNGQQKEIERYSRPLAEARKIEIKKGVFTGLSMGFLFFCLFSSYALSFYFGIYLIINDPERYNADVMFSVFFGVMTGLSNFGMAAPLMTAFGSARGAGAHIFQILKNVPTINPFLNRGLKPATVDGVIVFKNVVFQYPSRPDVPVLKGINLIVKSGQSVALVGLSGSGKSTIILLISRFYDAVEGSVSLDGIDVRDLSVRWLRGQIGLVGQEPILFNTTIRENIRLGRDDATYSDIVQAAKRANAHTFIMNLPKGYNTLVGEQGASLSGGQKQRIAIARALVRNPRVLLLDEATSALDTVSEALVQHALQKASEGRTTLTVAHRLTTVHNMDVIYVFKNGEIIETGKYDELVTSKGYFYELLTLETLGDSTTSNNKYLFEEALTEESIVTEDLKEMIEQDVTDEITESKTPILSFWRIVALNAPEWKSIAAGSISSIIIGFSMPLFVILFSIWFGSLSSNDTKVLMLEANNVAVTCLAIGFIMGVCTFIQDLSYGRAGAYLTERLRQRMFSHMLRQPIAYFDDSANSTGALCAKLSSEAALVHEATGQKIGIFLQALGSIGLALILALVYEWRVGLVMISFLPIAMIVSYYQGKMTTQESFGNAKTVELSTKIAIEAVLNIRTVASLGREPYIVRDYELQLQDAMPVSKRAAHCRGLVAGLSRAMFNFVNAVALTYGAHLIVSDKIPYQHIIVITQSLQMAVIQAQDMFIYAPDVQKGSDAASRIIALFNIAPSIRDPEEPAVIGFKSSGEASLTDIEFKYPTRPSVKVLRGLSLQIEKGKTVALVGKSGCGKSTVMQLLQRYYDPDAGIVALDGVPITQLVIDEARGSFGVVSQEPVLFDRSIAENIAYGDNSRTPATHEVIEAAKQANIHQFVISLPKGYETKIGASGTQLSGGQKQRIAIARALIRKPKILLLDEATSALDTESEKVVQMALDAAKEGRTCLMIAHRMSTVRDADYVYVFSEGRVAEAGTHHQLMELKGLYHLLYNAS